MNSQILNLLGTGASLGGVALSHRALGTVWERVTGNPPPAKNPDPEEAWTGIIIWSLVTGLVGTVIKVGITRQIAKWEAKPKAASQAEV
ncbi:MULTISPECIES: DUF4235 domain-containing protein [Kocuria]|jgi:hypothetical protein|uniref:DUF4235 domain-containing protein n=1 Tax=Kocuria TaxID=57493 RepID=UPI00203D87D0|nr:MULTISPECIES: DUF4235 domain-containing protein [Kocuria]MCM3686414.1 DUF4235 domain-containing protein [Kocuria rosea]HST71435.1 DUF4235 domain-containing protein [Kocuria rosea]